MYDPRDVVIHYSGPEMVQVQDISVHVGAWVRKKRIKCGTSYMNGCYDSGEGKTTRYARDSNNMPLVRIKICLRQPPPCNRAARFSSPSPSMASLGLATSERITLFFPYLLLRRVVEQLWLFLTPYSG